MMINDYSAFVKRILYMNILPCALHNFAGDFGKTALSCLQHFWKGHFAGSPSWKFFKTRPDHNTRNYDSYSLWEVRGLLNVPWYSVWRNEETGPTGFVLTEKTGTSYQKQMLGHKAAHSPHIF